MAGRFDSPPFSSPEFGQLGGREAIPVQGGQSADGPVHSGGGRQLYSMEEAGVAEGYRTDGSNQPQSGSGSGALSTSVTGQQAGTDSGGVTPQLPDLVANTVCLPEGALDAYEEAWAAGRAQQGTMSVDQQNRAALDAAGKFGFVVDPYERAILAEMYLAGIEGTGSDNGDGNVGTVGPDDEGPLS